MVQTEKELNDIKKEVASLWKLVLSQLEKTRQALVNKDPEIALEVISREKRVDAMELKIDCDCENFIALFTPVAIDLRLVLSLLKINGTLERIADFCEGISRYVVEEDCGAYEQEVFETLKIEKAFETLTSMLSDSYVALVNEDSRMSGHILAMDDEVDQLYRASKATLSRMIEDKKLSTICALEIYLIMRKLERIGDHCSNIVEEIVFYIDAKVLKHPNL